MTGEFRWGSWLAAAALAAALAAGCEEQPTDGASTVDAAQAAAVEVVAVGIAAEALPSAPATEGAEAVTTPEALAEGRLTGPAAEPFNPTSWADPDQGSMFLREDDPECCDEPGQADQCWHQDAEADGAACDSDGDCTSGSCDTALGLCECDPDSDENQCGEGICTEAGRCGPSWCNGYLMCSCWGGCVWWQDDDAYTPADACEASELYCCDGGYAVDPTAAGFCSNTSNCGEGECDTSADCTDQVGNACVTALCMDETCFYPAVNAAGCVSVMSPGETWADQDLPCCCNVDADCPTMPCVADAFCDIDPASATYHQCIFTWDPAGSSCEGEGSDPFGTDDTCGAWECTAAHDCVEVPNDGAACDAASGGPGGTNDDCGVYWCQGVNCLETLAVVGSACPNDQPEINDDCGTWACNGGGSCVETLPAAGSPCPNDQDHPDDTCGDWACDGSGDCIEYTHGGVSCDALHGGPGGLNDQCGIWICQAGGDCIENTALFDGAGCALASDGECNYGVCQDGACVEHFEVLGTGCNAAANDNCGAWQCNGSGTCAEITAPFNGNACDAANGGPGGNNDNCGVYQCSGGACLEVTLPFDGVACDDLNGGPGGTNDNCGKFFCNGAGGCVETTAAYLNVPCDAANGGPGGNNDNCGKYFCNGTGGCAETFYPGAACDAASGGPGGDNDTCGSYFCNALGGCAENTALYDGNLCAGAVGGDPCAIGHCLGGNCPYDMADGDTCTPVGPADNCSLYECLSQTCQNTGPKYGAPDTNYETCTPGYGPINVSATHTWDNDTACAADDYDPITTGRFSTCPATSYSDYVAQYRTTVDTSFSQQHIAVCLQRLDGPNPPGRSDNVNWNPLLYGRGENTTGHSATSLQCGTPDAQYTCNATKDMTNTNYTGYANTTCTWPNSSAITLGPWPLRDNPTTANAAGYTTQNEWRGSLMVDSRASTPPNPNGGEFRLHLVKEPHNNNDCRNTAAYVAAPLIKTDPIYGFWKDRWRGDTSGSGATFRSGLGGPWNENDCDDFVGFAGIKSDFFRLDFLGGTAASGWGHNYKVWTDPAGPGSLTNNVLTLWGGPNSVDGSCVNALKDPEVCRNTPTGLPQEHVFLSTDNGGNGFHGWLEVSNRAAGGSGTYEVNVLRSPRPFLGLTEAFMGESAANACGNSNAESLFTLYGYRLDFIPTNDAIRGYSVIATNLGPDTWLVDPAAHTTRCLGEDCANNPPAALPLPFAFPISGKFYNYYRIDPAGRIDFRETSTSPDMGGVYDRQPSSRKQTLPPTDGYAPSLMPAWGGLIPCWCSETTGGGWGSEPNWSGSCHKDDYGADGKGWLKSGTSVFENQTVEVITWSGFDSYVNPWRYSTSWFSGKTNCSIDSSAQAFEFQVIIFPDGKFSFYYRSTQAETAAVLDWTAWSTGVQGTRYATQNCPANATGDAWCDTHMGASSGDLACDYETDQYDTYSPGYRCVNPESQLHAGLPGSWNGGL